MTTQQDLLHKCQDPRWAAACIAGLEGEIENLEAQIKWLDNNTTFFNVDHSKINGTDTPRNVPVLASVSKRIWYHASDDMQSYPFSAVMAKALQEPTP